MSTHKQMDAFEKRNKPLPYQLCKNVNCSNAQQPDPVKNKLLLCISCFSPFWNPNHDEGNKNLTRTIVGKYHKQLTDGCALEICNNEVNEKHRSIIIYNGNSIAAKTQCPE